MSELITIYQLAQRLGVHYTTVRRRISRGTLGIPVLDISAGGDRRQARVRASDVDAYLKTREVAR